MNADIQYSVQLMINTSTLLARDNCSGIPSIQLLAGFAGIWFSESCKFAKIKCTQKFHVHRALVCDLSQSHAYPTILNRSPPTHGRKPRGTAGIPAKSNHMQTGL